MTDQYADDDIGTWMSKRWEDVKKLGRDAEAAGHAAWAAATRRGDDIAAPRSSDVQALGARSQARPAAAPPQPTAIRRGNQGGLSDAEIAGIIFNETRSLRGNGIEDARRNLAHVVMNGDEIYGEGRPITAPTAASPPAVERPTYDAAVAAVAAARAQRAQGTDSTNGATHFNFRPSSATDPWEGKALRSQTGPFTNSYPTKVLPAAGVYANTYEDD